jgi:hypothetical protein
MRLLDSLDSLKRPEVLEWACPVPFFGQIRSSAVATVGINPSNREFVDSAGYALDATNRRLPTLDSLSIRQWSDATGAHVREVVDSCERYFANNPYRLWFDVLERMLSAGGHSFYSGRRACHIDLVAFATRTKWGELDRDVQRELVEQGRRAMAEMIRDSPVGMLVLNGRSVVREFENFANTKLTATEVASWTLPRSSGRGVVGISYRGTISTIGDIDLDRQVTIFGYNHNLQSSFGVTSVVMRRIGEQVGNAVASASANETTRP